MNEIIDYSEYLVIANLIPFAILPNLKLLLLSFIIDSPVLIPSLDIGLGQLDNIGIESSQIEDFNDRSLGTCTANNHLLSCFNSLSTSNTVN